MRRPTTPARSIPIHLVAAGATLEPLPISPAQRQWLATQSFKGSAKKAVLLPTADGSLEAVAFGLGLGEAGEPSGPSELLIGSLASSLPAGTYHLAGDTAAAELGAIAWGLGAYKFTRYRGAS